MNRSPFALARVSLIVVAAVSLVACAEREEKHAADPQPAAPTAVAPQATTANFNGRTMAPRSNLLQRVRMRPILAASASASATASAPAP